MSRNLPVVLVVAVGLVTSLELAPAAAQGSASNRSASSDKVKESFIGTWKFVGSERRDANGSLLPPAAGTNQNRTGYIIYDPAGYMAVSIMPMGRKKYADVLPTEEEALAAITGYTGYFGTFTVDAATRVVTHHLQGSLNPGMAPEQKRVFEFSGNRLTLQTPPAPDGSRSRLTWERMPDLANPTAEQRRFFGFWRLVSNERRNEKGEVVLSNLGQTGYIIYTPAGFMMVHMMQPNRQRYAGARPTPAEARQTIRTYANYFGPFYVHEADGYVVHDQLGTANIGRNGPAPMQRFYRFTGNRLLLQPPRIFPPEGGVVQGTITWERAGGDGRTQ